MVSWRWIEVKLSTGSWKSYDWMHGFVSGIYRFVEGRDKSGRDLR